MVAIRPDALPAASSVDNTVALVIDNGTNVQKATPEQVVDAIRPLASQAEAEAGTDNAKIMTALRVNQAIQNNPTLSVRTIIGDGVSDETAALQAIINAMPESGGTIYGTGTLRITSTIILNKPIRLIGLGCSGDFDPSRTPGFSLKWDGSIGGTMMQLGGVGTATMIGGGIEHVLFDGNGKAARAVVHRNHQRGIFRDIVLGNVSGVAWELNNSLNAINGFHIFEDIRIPLRANLPFTQSAIGFFLNGSSVGDPAGVTLSTVTRMRIDHANGSGVKIGQIGDAWTWIDLFTFRANDETGPGVWFSADNATVNICGTHLFAGPKCSAGFRFDEPLVATACRIINASMIDVNTNAHLLYGAGAMDVVYEGSLGYNLGRGLIDGKNESYKDGFRFIEATSTRLTTREGNWAVSLVGSGSVTDAGQDGSAVRLQTGTANNDRTAVIDQANPASGSGWDSSPSYMAAFSIGLVTVTNVVLRVGFADSAGDTPTNGVYWEFDPSVNANWQCVTRRSGVETRVTSPLSGFAGRVELEIYVENDANSANFLYRANAATPQGFGASISTNVPTAPAAMVHRVKTKTTAAATLDLYSVMAGQGPDVALGIP